MAAAPILAALLLISAIPAPQQTATASGAPVAYNGPVTAWGVDRNGDGLYDELVVHVPILVNTSGEILVQAMVTVPTIDFPYLPGNPRYLSPGAYVWNLSVDGLELYDARLNGTYQVKLYLGDVNSSTPAASMTFTSGPYNWTAFTPPSASIRGAVTTQLVDLNGNGLADRLLFHVPVRVFWAGDYLVATDLADTPRGIAFYGLLSSRLLHLLPGDADAVLSYGGIAVNRLSTDGPWNLTVSVARLDAPSYDHVLSFLKTPAYLRSAFESRPVAWLSGNISRPGSCVGGICGDVLLVNPSDDFVMLGAEKLGLTGYGYDMAAYNGTFEVYVQPNLYPGVPVVVAATVAGNTTRDIMVPTMGPDVANRTVAFATANTTEEAMAYKTSQFAGWARFWADFDGNLDGVANASELGAFLAYMPVVSPPIATPLEALFNARLDNQGISAGYLSASNVSGAGSVTSTAAAAATLTRTWSTGVPAYPWTSHTYAITIGLNVNTSLGWDRITLPAGSNGTLTITSGATVKVLAPGDWLLQPTIKNYTGVFLLSTITISANVPVTSGSGSGGTPGGTGGLFGLGPELLLLWVVAGAAVGAVLVAVLFLVRRRRRPPQPSQPPQQR